MQAEIVDKKSGSRRSAEDTLRIALDRPSVILLKLSPESVARYERRGDDLVLVLRDGQEVLIPGFFIKYPEDSAGQASTDAGNEDANGAPAEEGHDRNELVLEDSNGVAWWGQYPEQWSEFHFTEIEWGDHGGVIWWPYLLGALGGVALASSLGGNGRADKAHPPVVVDDTASGDEDGGPITGNVLSNDTDVDGDTLTVTEFTISGTTYRPGDVATVPGVGTLTLSSDGSYTFTPEANWNGMVPTVTYTVSDGKGGTDTANLTITVKPVPDLSAGDDTNTTDEDTPVNGTVAPNDSTTSGGTLAFAKATDPANGTVVVNADGTYTYTPNPNYNGTDSFTYTVTDAASGESLTQTVTITVNPVNDAPGPEGVIGDQSSADAESITTLDITPFFTDVEGDTMTYSASGLPRGLTIDPNTGEISGTIDPSASQDGTSGVHSVTVTATDSSGASGTQTFTWTVTNPLPTANDDTAITDEDTAVSGNVLSGGSTGDVADSDPDGDVLVVITFTVAGDPGTYTAGDSATIAGVGTLTLSSDGSYTFTPEANWNGTAPTVTYTISDGEGGTGSSGRSETTAP